MNDTTVILFIIGETILVVGAIIVAWVKTREQIAALSVHVSELKSDHGDLRTRVDGISRHLGELTGYIRAKKNSIGSEKSA